MGGVGEEGGWEGGRVEADVEITLVEGFRSYYHIGTFGMCLSVK